MNSTPLTRLHGRRGTDWCFESPTGCWLWLKGTIRGYPMGYGHRKYWEAVNGPRPDGFHIHHRCRNPSCVNPDHLDAIHPSVHRSLHKLADAGLTLEDVRRIRERGREAGCRAEDLAAEYGVHVNTVRNYWREARWAELTGDEGQVVGPPRLCIVCGEPALPRRDARYCGQICRARAHRARKGIKPTPRKYGERARAAARRAA